ncbi:MAG TPA: isoprenylcysteine carboxylmethyltransferase family protein [Terriglobales bacterium]|nr:isoprenylcysteine carboxylmethyltransferase family protein [Terriglobales bacterium]
MIGKHIALTLIAGVGVSFVVWKALPPLWTPMQTAGVLLLAIGFVLWTIARFQLGASFAVTAQARQLVSHGVYSKIRNPIYVFGSCVVAGVFLLVGHPKFLLIFLIIIPMQIWRARKEAVVLEAKFGDQYRAYRASTWF